MGYAYLTFTQAKQALLARLADSGASFWTDGAPYSEVGIYLIEALRTYNALTGTSKTRVVVPTAVNTPFYALETVAAAACGHTVTDQDTIAGMQYHLLEPATPAAWTGSAQFTLADLTAALQRRRDQFLLDTGMVLTRITAPDQPATISRVVLPDTTIAIRRAAWFDPVILARTPLTREDEWAFTAFQQSWHLAPDTPLAYSLAVLQPLTVQIAPAPLSVGALDLLVVQAGAVLDPTTGVALGVPDDWAWVVKWGALADLLGRDGPGRDVPRATYCEARYQQGTAVAAKATRVLQARINDAPVEVAAVEDADRFNSGWQNTPGTPDAVMVAGYNMIGVSSAPDAGPYAITLDVVRNTPLPANNGAFVEVSREVLDGILDYAQHLAAFKCGGAEFDATSDQLNRFLRLCGVAEMKRRAEVPNRVGIDGRTARAEQLVPRQEASA